jgi:hypothetical protein
MKRLHVRLGAVLMVLLAVGTGAAWARPMLDRQPEMAAQRGLIQEVWSWLISIVDRAGAFTDPSGNDAVLPPPPPGDPVDPDL